MKVSVTVIEVQTYHCTKEIELTKSQLKYYQKNGKLPREIEDEVSSSGFQCHAGTEYISSEINNQ
jgi:hypothetical protein